MIKKLSLCALSIIAALPMGMAQAAENDMQLQQVLMFSRHNLRTPLADNGSVLEQSTKKSWPKWGVPGGQLTTKGGVLEVYMGNYTRQWLAQQGLARDGSCPDSSDVFVYANSRQRTIATAQYFVTGAFPGCDVAVTHQDTMDSIDPIFSTVITDESDAFKKHALSAMTAEYGKLNLKPAFQQLDKIVDYKSSSACTSKKQCSLSSGTDRFSAENGHDPELSGPLKTGNSLVDAFTLQYYEGFPLDQVAWGQIKTPEQWQALSAIKNGYQDTLFSSPEVAREVAAPLVDYIRSLLVDQESSSAPKITLMVGHDTNIASMLSALQVQPYQLPGSYESTPIGGQIVFQRWHDKKNNKDLLKLEYVYQTADQLRNTEVLSLKKPPMRVTLQLAGCPVDSNGYCSWDKFTQVLNGALQGTPMQPAVPQAAEATSDNGNKPQAAQDKAAAPKAEKAKADKTKAAAEKDDADKAAADKAAADKAAADKAAAEKVAADKAAADKAAAEKVAADKAAADKAAAEKVAADKAAADKAAAEKVAADKAAADKAAAEKAAADKAAVDKAAADKAAADKAATDKPAQKSSAAEQKDESGTAPAQ